MKRRTGWALLALTPLVLLALAWDPSSHAAKQEQVGKNKRAFENIDSRKNGDKETQSKFEAKRQRNAARFGDKHASVVKELSLARAAFKETAPGVEIEVDEQTQAPQVVRARGNQRLARKARGRISGESVVRDFLGRNARLYGLTTRQVAKLKKISEYKNPEGSLSWLELKQEIDGLPVFQAELRAAFDADGNLFQTVSSLVPGLNDEEESGRKGGAASLKALPEPTLSAAQAVAYGAASIGMNVNPNELTVKEQDSDGHVVIFNAGPFANEVRVELQYFPMKAGEVTLAWSMILYQEEPAYYTFVDAESGDLLWRKNLVNDQTQAAMYAVYGSDSPAPLSPLLNLLSATVPTDQGAAVGRDIFSLIHQHPSQNDPWLNDGDNTTIGNNVDAGLDLVAPDGIEPATRPVGTPFRVFDFPYDPGPGLVPPGESPTLANYRFGEVVNMFYWTNRFHDIMYGLGFTEAARNFQQNNFLRGGLGNDRVLAQGQDSSGTNNANFLTPPDGTSGRMQMFIFTGPTPDRTSGIDQEILIHELTHGVSNRLHGNAAGLNFAQGGGMGEGWSDFFARAILSDASEDINGLYGAGGYSTHLLQGIAGYNTNYYYGIRRFPYALRTTLGANGRPHNPLTFADVDASKINLTDGAFPRGPVGSATAHQVHNVGEVWSVTLMEVRARLIALHGFAVGNQRVMQLVIDGMKLNPADPTILQARDSILAASAASGGGPLEEKAIWEGFADSRHGLRCHGFGRE